MIIAASCAKKIKETGFVSVLEIKMKLPHALSDVGYTVCPLLCIVHFLQLAFALTKCGYWC